MFATGSRLRILRKVCDETFGGEEEASYRSSVDDRGTGYLSWVDHATSHEILVFTGCYVITVSTFVFKKNFLDDV